MSKTEPKTERAAPWPMTTARVDIAISRELSDLLEERFDGGKRKAIQRIQSEVQLPKNGPLEADLKKAIEQGKLESALDATKDIPDEILRMALEKRTPEKGGE